MPRILRRSARLVNARAQRALHVCTLMRSHWTVCSFFQVGSISTYALFVGRDFPDGITCFAGPQRVAKVDLLMT
jgi:hypothetical protein